MTREAILRWLDARRFKPFEIRLSNGDRFSVWHPEALLVSTTTAVLQISGSNRNAEIALLHVAAVEHLLLK
jgi:hypothetical protein